MGRPASDRRKWNPQRPIFGDIPVGREWDVKVSNAKVYVYIKYDHLQIVLLSGPGQTVQTCRLLSRIEPFERPPECLAVDGQGPDA